MTEATLRMTAATLRMTPATLRVTAVALGMTLVASCAAPRTGAPRPADEPTGSAIRVLLASGLSTADVGATGAWFMLDPQRRLMARVGPGDQWRIERSGDKLRGVRGSVK